MSDFLPYPLKFRPWFQPRIWGGDYFARVFPDCPSGSIGEVWTLSGLEAAPSVCLNGSMEGRALPQIVAAYSEAYLGQAVPGAFPVLIKLIDAAADLSVQVHPDDQTALRLQDGQGKIESWYVLHAEADATVITGLDSSGPAEVAAALTAGRLSEHLVRRRVQAGDLVHVPAGTVHALCSGVRVIEVQQASDITYRLFDWNRVGADGLPRQLHIDESLQAIRFGEQESGGRRADLAFPLQTASRHLVQCPYYSIDELCLHSAWSLPPSSRPLILIVAGGQGRLLWPGQIEQLRPGDTCLLPTSADSSSVVPDGELTLLLVAFTESRA